MNNMPTWLDTAIDQPLSSDWLGDPFALGVASGDPSPDGMVLWTGLAPDPLNGGGMSVAPVEVTWACAHKTAAPERSGKGLALRVGRVGYSQQVGVRPTRGRGRVGGQARRRPCIKAGEDVRQVGEPKRLEDLGCTRGPRA